MRLHLSSQFRTAAVGLAAAALAFPPAAATAHALERGTMVPIGSDYQPVTMEAVARQAVRGDRSGHVVLLVLPITYSYDAYTTDPDERAENMALAEERAGSLEEACNAVRSATQTCDTQVVPALIRSDAYLPSVLGLFTPDVDAMYVLGGDQTVAMQLVAGTPLEAAMARAYRGGAVLGGNSAGMAVQSANMINGYTGDNGPEQSLQRGAVDVWTDSGGGDLTRGLSFGMRNAITDTHVFEYGRMGRSLNVAVTTRVPVLGMDAVSGAVVRDDRYVTDVVGDTGGYVIDPLAYRATGAFGGPNSTLAARRVAVQVLAPGGAGYDLVTHRALVRGREEAAPPIAGRQFPRVVTGASGALLLAGGLSSDPGGIAGRRFAALAGGRSARIVVIAAGYASDSDAAADAARVGAALQPGVLAPVREVVLGGATDLPGALAALRGATGIYLTAPDRSTVLAALRARPAILASVWARWQRGATLLADNAAAAALGTDFVAQPNADDPDEAAIADMHGVSIARGLGWYRGITVQPRILPDQTEPQLLQLARASRGAIAVGVDQGTALEVRAGTARVRGDSAAMVLDGRRATWGTGSNGSLTVRWLVADTFVDGQALVP